MSLFKGSGVAIVTPMKGNKINFDMFRSLIEWHINEGTDAIVVCGTTGESATLSAEEKKAIYQFAVEVADKKISVIAGSGTNNTEESIELSTYAESVGVDALLVITPYYNKPTQRGLYAHFKAISEHVNIPMILYNVPSRTGVNLLPETVAMLAKLSHIDAIKEASSDISQIAKMIDLCPDDFVIYSGNDDQTMAILALGGQGVISVTANIIPKIIHDQVMAYLSGDRSVIKKALSFGDLHQVMFIESNPVPVKAALTMMGFDVGGTRLPLVDLELKHSDMLRQTLQRYGLLEDRR